MQQEPDFNISDDEFEKSLSGAMIEVNTPSVLKPFPSMPKANNLGRDRSKIVADATHEDTERSSHKMQEQMEVIVQGLEREITEAKEVRATTDKRIKDLSFSLDAAKAALDVLKRKKE